MLLYSMTEQEVVDNFQDCSSVQKFADKLGISRPTALKRLREFYPNFRGNWSSYLKLTGKEKDLISINYARGIEALSLYLKKPKAVLKTIDNPRVLEYWGIEQKTNTKDQLVKKFKYLCAGLNITPFEAIDILYKEPTMNSGTGYNRPGYLYVCYFPKLNFYKIGVTTNWNTRKLQFGETPELLSLLSASYRMCLAAESYLLDKAVPYNSRRLSSGNTETYRTVKNSS